MTAPSALWVPFADDVIPVHISESDLWLIESMWARALGRLGCACETNEPFFAIRGAISSLNLNLLIETLSTSALHAEPGAAGTFRITAKNPFTQLVAMLKLQFRIERFIAPGSRHASTETFEERRILSLALGICQQVLMMRLPSHTPKELALWLMNPATAPRAIRRTLKQLLRLQKERNQLSSAWTGFFAERSYSPAVLKSERSSFVAGVAGKNIWNGLPVFPGKQESSFHIDPDFVPAEGGILIFSVATPETVRLFPQASAVLFLRGGILSHACCVARERKLPCITAIGSEFLEALQREKPKRLRMDAQQGTIEFVSS